MLSICQLTTAGVVHAEATHDGIHDEQRETILVVDHQTCCLDQKLFQVLRGIAPRTNDVVHRRLGRHTLGLGDLPHAIRAKGALRVDVNHLTIGAAHIRWHLRHHREGMAQLRLSTAELSEDLGDRTALNASAKHLIKFASPCSNLKAALHLTDQLSAGHKTYLAGLSGGFDDLVHLLVGQPLDAQQIFAHCKSHGLAGVETSVLQLLQVCSVDATLLKLVDQTVGHIFIIRFHQRMVYHGGGSGTSHSRNLQLLGLGTFNRHCQRPVERGNVQLTVA